MPTQTVTLPEGITDSLSTRDGHTVDVYAPDVQPGCVHAHCHGCDNSVSPSTRIFRDAHKVALRWAIKHARKCVAPVGEKAVRQRRRLAAVQEIVGDCTHA